MIDFKHDRPRPASLSSINGLRIDGSGLGRWERDAWKQSNPGILILEIILMSEKMHHATILHTAMHCKSLATGTGVPRSR